MLQIQNHISIKIQYSKKLNVQNERRTNTKCTESCGRKQPEKYCSILLKAMFNIAISFSI